MNVLIRLWLKFSVFWLSLFFVQRCIFMWMGRDKVPNLGFSEFIETQIHALRMDISMTAYILILPALVFVLLIFSAPQKDINWRRSIRSYFLMVVLISAVIHIADIGLFTEWGSKMNRKALSYMAFPDKVMASSLSTPLALFCVLVMIQLIVSRWIFKRYLNDEVVVTSSVGNKVAFSLVLLTSLVIGIRGGIQELPIKKSVVYFSRHNMLNLASLNSTWNFMELVFHSKDPISNPYMYFEQAEAEEIYRRSIAGRQESIEHISKTDQPNILVILLESWSGDIIEKLDGEKGVTPAFTQLCSEGILFDRFYSTGFRTEQGQVALISGFPAQPTTAIMKSFGKFDKLPGLPDALKQLNYYSAYYYTGDLEYANMGRYLHSAGFDLILGEEDVEFQNKTYWGAFDEELFDYSLEHMKDLPQPFFSMLMTSTSHEPFDAPVNEGFSGKEPADLYRNTVHYTDRVMGDYLREAKSEDWYEQTLIFIVSDHAHRLPKNRERHERERHHIPFLITGGALKDRYRGTVDHRIASHVDFPATILDQLDLGTESFKYSKGLFRQGGPAFAFYSFEDGFGWIEEDGSIIYDHQLGSVLDSTLLPSSSYKVGEILSKGKAYLQTVMQDYVDY